METIIMQDNKPDFFDMIFDILKKGSEERGLKEGPILIKTPEFKGVSINMPKMNKDAYHGSSYEILCDNSKLWCKIKGDIVVDPDSEITISKLIEESDCKTFKIHRHTKTKEKYTHEETHLHFMCEDKDRYDTIAMAEFLKQY
jgi:hypothetical protein